LNSGLLFEISHQIEYFALSSEVTIDKLFQVSWHSVRFCTFYNANDSMFTVLKRLFTLLVATQLLRWKVSIVQLNKYISKLVTLSVPKFW